MLQNKPIRILHVVGSMSRGGVETWLVQVLRHIDRSRFHLDILTHTDLPCAYDDEVRALGSRIIPCLHSSRPWLYARNLRRILRQYGPYDVIHSHLHYFSGFILKLAASAGVPVRIAHSRNDLSVLYRDASTLRRAYIYLTKRLIARYATHLLAVSDLAALDLFGPDSLNDPRYSALYSSLDLAPFSQRPDIEAVRADLGIPPDRFVIGHVGRMVPQKNHSFLLRIMKEIVDRDSNTHLLLIGDGPLRPQIEQQVRDLSLVDRVTFAGERPDVPRLMMGAMDVFLFPSLHEGLGRVVLEAQAAGLPCVISDAVPHEVDVVSGLVHRQSLQDLPVVWADTVLRARTLCPVTPGQALGLIGTSPFSIAHCVERIQDLYLAAASGASIVQGPVLRASQ